MYKYRYGGMAMPILLVSPFYTGTNWVNILATLPRFNPCHLPHKISQRLFSMGMIDVLPAVVCRD